MKLSIITFVLVSTLATCVSSADEPKEHLRKAVEEAPKKRLQKAVDEPKANLRKELNKLGQQQKDRDLFKDSAKPGGDQEGRDLHGGWWHSSASRGTWRSWSSSSSSSRSSKSSKSRSSKSSKSSSSRSSSKSWGSSSSRRALRLRKELVKPEEQQKDRDLFEDSAKPGGDQEGRDLHGGWWHSSTSRGTWRSWSSSSSSSRSSKSSKSRSSKSSKSSSSRSSSKSWGSSRRALRDESNNSHV